MNIKICESRATIRLYEGINYVAMLRNVAKVVCEHHSQIGKVAKHPIGHEWLYSARDAKDNVIAYLWLESPPRGKENCGDDINE